MTRSYIQCGNLYFVPILRNRLSFATLVHRAFHELHEQSHWCSEDLIAVTLPPSLRGAVEKAVNRLPRVSLLQVRVEGEGQREIFPVTPCDGRIEAIRTGWDKHNNWPVEFVDLEISPGNLLRGPCVQDPDWPDDSLVHYLGVERYLDLITPYFSVPPARLDPLDTWRENAVADRLRHLYPLYRRVLVACDAPLVRPVIQLLQQEAPAFTVDLGHHKRKFDVDIVQQLRPEILLSYLDDFPKLVEQFDKDRSFDLDIPRPGWSESRPGWDKNHLGWSEGHPDSKELSREVPFDKRSELIRMVQECAHRAHDLHFSTRQHKAFDTFLNNLLRFSQRICPRPEMLYSAATSCFGSALAERIFCYLASYGQDIKVENVRLSESEAVRSYKVGIDNQIKNTVSRSCDPNPSSYTYQRPSNKKEEDNNNEKGMIYTWMPEVFFMERMRTKLHQVTVSHDRQPASTRYRGSTEMGIDIRRTLRTAHRGLPDIYVKAYAKQAVEIPTQHEPVVWILTEEWSNSALFESRTIGRPNVSRENTGPLPGKDFLIGEHNIFEVLKNRWEIDSVSDIARRLDYNGSQNGSVIYTKRCGWITFGTLCESLDQAKEIYGSELETRYPNHKDYEHPRGCVHRDLVKMEKEGAGWVEIALLTALRQARHAVVVVAPANFSIPQTIYKHPIYTGQKFVFVPLSSFSRGERERLTSNYKYWSLPGDKNAEANFSILMRRYWE